jgi:hypothetical protein
MPASLGTSPYDNEPQRLAGKFVAVWREVVSGPWGSYHAALQSGYEEFGLAPFVVKRAEDADAAKMRKLRAAI